MDQLDWLRSNIPIHSSSLSMNIKVNHLGFEAHEMAKPLVELLENKFGSENVNVEILKAENSEISIYQVFSSI